MNTDKKKPEQTAAPNKNDETAAIISEKKRKWSVRFMILLGLAFGAIVLAVQYILLPFILAVVIAYIFSPVVDRLCSRKIRNRMIPRWIAVILIYFVMGVSLYSFSVIVMPRFAGEFAKLAEDAPDFFRKASQVWIPKLNNRMQDLIKDFTEPMAESEKALETGLKPAAEKKQGNKKKLSKTEKVDKPTVPPDLNMTPAEPVSMVFEQPDDSNHKPVINPDEMAEAFFTRLESYDIEINATPEHNYRVKLIDKRKKSDKSASGGFNLDITIKQYLEKMLSSGQKLIADSVTLGKSIVAIVVSSLMTLVLTLMLAAFIMIDTPRILKFFRSLCPPAYRKEYDTILVGIDRGLGGVIRGQLLICLVNGTLTGIGLLILGVKYAVILAMIAAVFSLIPIFGTILSSIPSVGIALTQSFGLGLAVLIWIVIIHLVEANLLNPKIIGTAAEIHPVMVVFALVAGEHAYGLFGALLAVATYSIFQTLFVYFHRRAYKEDV
jgi:predicted PurR-regulated permease PerM